MWLFSATRSVGLSLNCRNLGVKQIVFNNIFHKKGNNFQCR